MTTHYGGRELVATLTPCGELRKGVRYEDDWKRVTCLECLSWLGRAWHSAPVGPAQTAKISPAGLGGADLIGTLDRADAASATTEHADGGSTTLACLMCGGVLEDLSISGHPPQPSDGVIVTIHGNYGSTVYDPNGGEHLVSYLCDPCLTAKAGDKLFSRVTELRAQPVLIMAPWQPFDGDGKPL